MRNAGWVLVLSMLLIGPSFGPVPKLLMDVWGLELRPAALALLGWLVVAAALLAWLTWRRAQRQGLSPADLGIRPARGKGSVAGACALALAWGFLLSGAVLQSDPTVNLGEMSLYRAGAAILGALVAIGEDFVVRGYLMESLRRDGRGAWTQVGLSALVFALYHSLLTFSVEVVVGGMIFSLVYGALLAGLYLWGGRSLLPVVVAHAGTLLLAEPFGTMAILLTR